MFNKLKFLSKLFFNHIHLEDDIQYVGLCHVKVLLIGKHAICKILQYGFTY